jgi:glycerol transport system permease protein
VKPRFSILPVLYLAFLLIPIYWLLTMSFKTNAEIGGQLTLYPHHPTLASYRYILSEPSWFWGYVNASAYVLLNGLLCVSVALPAAYAFSRFQFFAARPLFFGFLAFRMLSPAILLIPMVQLFSDLNLIDTYLAVALAHCFFNLPIAIWILEGFISSVPRELDELAQIEGYSFSRFFRKILIPEIAPGLAVTVFFCFMFSWTEVILSNALTTIYAKPIGAIMSRVSSVFVANVAMLSAAGVLTLIPGILVVILVRKHLARGFSLGRVDL